MENSINIPSLWARSIAMVIDNTILMIAWFIIFHYSLYKAYIFICSIMYFTISQTKFGNTLGNRIFNIKILDHLSLEKPTFLQALSRCLMFFIFTSIPLVNIIFLVSMIFNDQKRGWHDLISSTIVIKTLQINKQAIKI